MENQIVNIDGHGNVEETETDLLCATVRQPISVGIDGSSIDFQLYTGVSIYLRTLCVNICCRSFLLIFASIFVCIQICE